MFKCAKFQDKLALCQQKINFSRTGAHHQNRIAEGVIQKTSLWARAILQHELIL